MAADYEKYTLYRMIQSDGEMSLYPNPATDFISFQLDEHFLSGKTIRLKITDLPGRTWLETEFVSAPVYTDISKLNAGVYLAEISNGYDRRTLKFVKN